MGGGAGVDALDDRVEHASYEDAHERGEGLGASAEQPDELGGRRQNVLADRHVGEDALHQTVRDVVHAPCAAAGADSPALAGQRERSLGAALFASEAEEAGLLGDATGEVALEGGLDELGDGAARSFELLDEAGPGRLHQGMKGTGPRISWDVGDARCRHRRAQRERRATRRAPREQAGS